MIFASTSFASMSGYAAESPTAEPLALRDRVSFYSRQVGDIAFLPHSNNCQDAKYMTTFWVLEDHKCYQLPKRDCYGFVANIRDISKKLRTPSFLAVTIVEVFDPESISAGVWAALLRNENWMRPDDAEFKEFPREFPPRSNVTFEDVKRWQDSLPSMLEFDSALQKKTKLHFTWHAKPKDGVTSSWDYRTALFGPASYQDLGELVSNGFQTCVGFLTSQRSISCACPPDCFDSLPRRGECRRSQWIFTLSGPERPEQQSSQRARTMANLSGLFC
jgi:hypothetical protein